jgi:hypothetical protein
VKENPKSESQLQNCSSRREEALKSSKSLFENSLVGGSSRRKEAQTDWFSTRIWLGSTSLLTSAATFQTGSKIELRHVGCYRVLKSPPEFRNPKHPPCRRCGSKLAGASFRIYSIGEFGFVSDPEIREAISKPQRAGYFATVSPSPQPSPLGRGSLDAGFRSGRTHRFFADLAAFLPLPKGEGWGEGKQAGNRSFADILKSPLGFRIST